MAPVLLRLDREIGEEGIGALLGQRPIHVDRFLRCGQRLLAAIEIGERWPRLIRLIARSGRKASGRSLASAR